MAANVSTVLLVACVACSASTHTVDFSVSAQTNYERGLKEIEHRDWNAATQYFEFVMTRFDYSKWAEFAELRLADILFDTERYAEAITAYRKFIMAHPTHVTVDDGYVSFRIGEATGRSTCGQ